MVPRPPFRRPAPGPLFLGLVMLLALGAAPALGQDAEAGAPAGAPAIAPGDATLDDLAWIAGTWRGTLGGGVIEEHWSAPEGDNMLGMFRYVQGGKATFYELLVIEHGDAGPVLRLKHFHPGLRGWEEKDEAVTFPMTELAGRRAVFLETDGSTRLIFERHAEDTLTIELAKTAGGSQRFEYQRMP